jgi:hypothetical protein
MDFIVALPFDRGCGRPLPREPDTIDGASEARTTSRFGNAHGVPAQMTNDATG